MTAKEEILALMEQIPDGLTVSDTIARLQSAHAANGGVEKLAPAKSPTDKEAPPGSAPPPLDGQAIKDEIVAIVKRLPEDLTAAEAVCEAADDLRLFYFVQKDFEDIREGRALPFEERDNTPEFYDEVPEFSGISVDELDRMTVKEKLEHTMNLLPSDLTLGRAVYEALERLLFFYSYEKASENIREGKVIPFEEVVRRLQKK